MTHPKPINQQLLLNFDNLLDTQLFCDSFDIDNLCDPPKKLKNYIYPAIINKKQYLANIG
jgi:hypothetical protein